MSTPGTERRESPKNLRAGYQTITPYLTVKRAEQLVEFVKQVFGGVETFRATGSAGGLHAEVRIGESRLMIGGYESVEEIPTALHLYVPDADAVYQRALEAGATSLEEPVDQFYGDREAGVRDPSGNVWWIATHKLGPAQTYIPEGLRPVTPFLHPIGAPALIEFMKQAFDAEEISREQSPEGMIHHATVRIGDSMIEMGEAHGDAQPMPPALYTYVENLEETYERALKAGATSLQPPTDQGYGDRTAWVKDAWGNIWYLAAPVQQR
jgi:PhnB protein